MSDRRSDGTFIGGVGTHGEQRAAGVNENDSIYSAGSKMGSYHSNNGPGASVRGDAGEVLAAPIMALVNLCLYLLSVYSRKNISNFLRACTSWPSFMLPISWLALNGILLTIALSDGPASWVVFIIFFYLFSTFPIALGHLFGRKEGISFAGKTFLKAKNEFSVRWKRLAWLGIFALAFGYQILHSFDMLKHLTAIVADNNAFALNHPFLITISFCAHMIVNLIIFMMIVVLSAVEFKWHQSFSAGRRVKPFLEATEYIRVNDSELYQRAIIALIVLIPDVFYLDLWWMQIIVLPFVFIYGYKFWRAVSSRMEHLSVA